MKHLTFVVLFVACLARAQSVPPQRGTYGPISQAGTITIPNTAGSQAVTFEYLYSATPASASITIQGCMRGKDGAPGVVGTCDSATDTYTGTSNSIRSPSFTKVYDTFLITAGTLSGATLTVNTTVVVSKAGTSSGGAGGAGTVTNTGGALTANAVVLGAGGNDTKVSTGITTNGASELDVGVSGTSGVFGLNGSTSGKATLTAPAVAGTVTNAMVSSNVVSAPAGTNSSASFQSSAAANSGMNFSSNFPNIIGGGTEIVLFGISSQIRASSVQAYCWSSSTPTAAGCDTGFTRSASSVISADTTGTSTGTAKLKAAGYMSVGTTFTSNAGCAETTLVGGATAGKYTSVTAGTCTVVVTMGNSATAPNGWSCTATDLTTAADAGNIKQTATTTTTASLNETTVAANDVIQFSCIGY